ncbi:hypothetical protein SAMN02745130_02190 [Thiothrix eikelboomii]|uniref:Uncharacterized protein n=1 Tax=Thiothrix eikelboomii TaxID=92487 RepID=A0A1T4WWS9_9GAMM|nr:hypothetical protein [Thiothrix eikelboomii]SKA81328.1 hypothetical protein SAMN02745130_02190 [Thiothrix eikelboomii]
MTMTLQQQLQQGIQTHLDAAAFFQEQGALIQSDRAKLATDVAAAGQQLLDKVAPTLGEVLIYVDGKAAAGGNGSSQSPYSSLDEALDKVPAARPTVIYLRGDNTYTLNPGAQQTKWLYWKSPNVRIEHRGGTAKPIIVVPHFESSDGYAYPTLCIHSSGLAYIHFYAVTLELKPSLNNKPSVGYHSCFLYPWWGSSLSCAFSHGKLIIPSNMALISPYVLAMSISLMFYGLELLGGGNIVYTHYQPLITIFNYAGSLATDTYILSQKWSNASHLLTNYTGAQLARVVA